MRSASGNDCSLGYTLQALSGSNRGWGKPEGVTRLIDFLRFLLPASNNARFHPGVSFVSPDALPARPIFGAVIPTFTGLPYDDTTTVEGNKENEPSFYAARNKQNNLRGWLLTKKYHKIGLPVLAQLRFGTLELQFLRDFPVRH